MNKSNKNKAFVVVLVLILSFGFGTLAQAEGSLVGPSTIQKMPKPTLIGKVVSISETSLTITTKDDATYTVDTTGAKVFKREISGTSKDSLTTSPMVAIGDSVAIVGTLTGTAVANTTTIYIISSLIPGVDQDFSDIASQPVLRGQVTAVTNGSATVTTKDGTAYSVETLNAKIMKKSAPALDTSTTSNTPTVPFLTVGDSVVVLGTLAGTAVTNTTMIYVLPPTPPQSTTTTDHPVVDKQPTLIGTVTTVTESGFTLTGRDGKNFAIDTTKTIYVKAGETTNTSDDTTTSVAVGDTVAVFGTPSDTMFMASRVITGIKMVETDMRKSAAPVVQPTSVPTMSTPIVPPQEPVHLLQKITNILGKLKFW